MASMAATNAPSKMAGGLPPEPIGPYYPVWRRAARSRRVRAGALPFLHAPPVFPGRRPELGLGIEPRVLGLPYEREQAGAGGRGEVAGERGGRPRPAGPAQELGGQRDRRLAHGHAAEHRGGLPLGG